MYVLLASAILHLQSMSVEEKIGQLFVVPACPLRGEDHIKDLEHLFKTYHIGGIILKQGDAASTIALLNRLPADLLRVADAEWGVGMRVSDAVKYPRNQVLGAIEDPLLLERFGHQVGKECRQLGIDLNLAPVADTNISAESPIGMRSFGNNPQEVAWRARTVAMAMQEEGVMACGKHFPNYGGSSADAHFELPVLQEMELTPFKALVKGGVKAIMTAHLVYKPSGEIVTFSPSIVAGILRNQWGFDGLIVTDALNMAAVKKEENGALKALLAGHDLLLYGDHISEAVDEILSTLVPQAYQSILEAYHRGVVTDKMLDEHVARILKAKKEHLPLEVPVLITPEAENLNRELASF